MEIKIMVNTIDAKSFAKMIKKKKVQTILKNLVSRSLARR